MIEAPAVLRFEAQAEGVFERARGHRHALPGKAPQEARGHHGAGADLLHVRLRDRHGAADPIGARVTLVTTSRAGERRQVRESMGQTTFRGQGADPFSFAVPRGERTARLEVRWPDGSRETRPVSSAPDRVLEIRQR